MTGQLTSGSFRHPIGDDLDVSNSGKPKTVERYGRTWQLGDGNTVSWINRETPGGLAITSAIPPRFDAYATIAHMEDFTSPEDLAASQERVVDVLRRHGSTEWWLGYLDTGSDDIVFPGARKMKLYAGWRYVIVKAGPDQALTWRETLPDLAFPVDRTWCLSTLWDDSWTCLGGSDGLIDQLASDPHIELRRVELGDDATPPGHIACDAVAAVGSPRPATPWADVR